MTDIIIQHLITEQKGNSTYYYFVFNFAVCFGNIMWNYNHDSDWDLLNLPVPYLGCNEGLLLIPIFPSFCSVVR